MNPNDLQSVVANLVQRIGDGAQKYGPQALDLVGQYLHYIAIASLCIGFVLVFATAGFIKLALWCTHKGDNTNEDVIYFSGFIIFGLAMFSGFSALVNLLDPMGCPMSTGARLWRRWRRRLSGM